VQELAKREWTNKTWTTKKGQQRGGRQFDKSSVYDLLTNPIYIGKLKHKTERFNGEHEAIIEPAVFEKVQTQLKQHGGGRGNFLKNKHGALLRGLLYCQACEQAMVHTFTGRGTKRYRYYTCVRAIKRGHKECPSRSLPAAEIERVVVDQIRSISQDAALRTEVLRQATAQSKSRIAELRTEQRQLERQLGRIHAELQEYSVVPKTNALAMTRIADLQAQVAGGEERLREIRTELETVELGLIDETEIAAALADFDRVWNALSSREQAEVIRLLIARVGYDHQETSISISFHPTALHTLVTMNRKDDAA
ncbi:MAG: recombinase zinc beta ribbon domain-containing protein, partial [Pirellulaceae bacterium]